MLGIGTEKQYGKSGGSRRYRRQRRSDATGSSSTDEQQHVVTAKVEIHSGAKSTSRSTKTSDKAAHKRRPEVLLPGVYDKSTTQLQLGKGQVSPRLAHGDGSGVSPQRHCKFVRVSIYHRSCLLAAAGSGEHNSVVSCMPSSFSSTASSTHPRRLYRLIPDRLPMTTLVGAREPKPKPPPQPRQQQRLIAQASITLKTTSSKKQRRQQQPRRALPTVDEALLDRLTRETLASTGKRHPLMHVNLNGVPKSASMGHLPKMTYKHVDFGSKTYLQPSTAIHLPTATNQSHNQTTKTVPKTADSERQPVKRVTPRAHSETARLPNVDRAKTRTISPRKRPATHDRPQQAEKPPKPQQTSKSRSPRPIDPLEERVGSLVDDVIMSASDASEAHAYTLCLESALLASRVMRDIMLQSLANVAGLADRRGQSPSPEPMPDNDMTTYNARYPAAAIHHKKKTHKKTSKPVADKVTKQLLDDIQYDFLPWLFFNAQTEARTLMAQL